MKNNTGVNFNICTILKQFGQFYLKKKYSGYGFCRRLYVFPHPVKGLYVRYGKNREKLYNNYNTDRLNKINVGPILNYIHNSNGF